MAFTTTIHCRPSAARRRLRWFCLLSLLSLVGIYASFAATNYERLQKLAQSRYGEGTLARVQQWMKLIESSQALPTSEKLHAVNDFFNVQLRFTSDESTWNQVDYWATPLESLYKQEGDCEDFSLAKYVTLLSLGLPEDSLRLVYVQARLGADSAAGSAAGSATESQAHMVLAYYSQPNAEPLILDNLRPQIQHANKRPDLTPVFSFNASSLWVAGQSAQVGNSQARLSKWQDVLQRIRGEGFLYEQ